jgi:hypothetical protein
MSRQGFDTGAIRYDGSPMNKGSFHRAIACCQHLVERGRWDGQTQIVIHDPHKAHHKVSFYKKDLVEGVDWELIPETPDRWTFTGEDGQQTTYGVGDTVTIRFIDPTSNGKGRAKHDHHDFDIKITYMFRDLKAVKHERLIYPHSYAGHDRPEPDDPRGFMGEVTASAGGMANGLCFFGFHEQVVAVSEVRHG